jgi:hypothetical protein
VITKTNEAGKEEYVSKLNAKEVADLIRKDKNYRPGKGVTLYVCNSGKKLAGEVAKELQDTVKAPTGVIKPYAGKSIPVLENGEWVTFSSSGTRL